MDTDRKIKYNYPQLKVISKALELEQSQQIKEVQKHDLDTKYYKNQKLIYILKSIAEEFIKEFYRGIIQGYNKATTLVLKL